MIFRPRYLRIILMMAIMICIWLIPGHIRAEYTIPWQASFYAAGGSSDFSPHYIGSRHQGMFTNAAGAYLLAQAERPLLTSHRFEYGFGMQAGASITNAVDYERYRFDVPTQTGTWSNHGQRAPYVWLQQLWAGIKYRGFFLTAGMKDSDRSLFDSPLGSGDIVVSDNARPVPQLRFGFIDFQDIPFTRGLVQIQGEIAYGKFTDSDWLRSRYNYYNSFITTDVWFHYKRCYFRVTPQKPFSVTLGMQHAAQFGGYYEEYDNGQLVRTGGGHVRARDFLDVFVQKRGSSGTTGGDRQYYNGNHLGSWDLRARYRFRDSSELTAYFQWPWEDGSGIGKLNGWDGVWGLEYKFGRRGWIDAACVEYIDFTNQSGPIHWAPGDHEGNEIPGQATGADDYYNNYFYDGWANYGMSMGTPFIKSPIYNTDGYLRFTDNRLRGFHAGISGSPTPDIDYRLLVGYRQSLGTPTAPSPHKRQATSAMLEGKYRLPALKGLTFSLQLAFDAGSLTGNRFGAMLGVTYDGLISLGKHQKATDNE